MVDYVMSGVNTVLVTIFNLGIIVCFIGGTWGRNEQCVKLVA